MKIKHLLSIMFLCLIPLVMLAQPFGQLVRKFNLTHKGTGPITCNKNYLFVGNATNDTIFIYNVNDGNYTGFKKIIFTDWGFFSTDTRFFLNADDYTLIDFDISNINNWSVVQTVAGLDRGWMASWANDSSMIAWNGHWAGSYQFFDISAGTLVEKCKVSTGGNPYSATRYQDYVFVANAYSQDRRIDISNQSSCAGSAWGSSYGMMINSTNSGNIINYASLSTAPFLIEIRNQLGTLTGSIAGQENHLGLTLPENYLTIENTSVNNTVLYDINDGTFNHPVKTLFNNTLGGYTYNSNYILRIVNDSCEVYSRFSPNLQATNITFSNNQAAQLSFNWTDGDGTKRIVFINQDTLSSPLPVFNTTYSANTILGSGSQIGSSGWYCVFNGTTHPDGVSVTNLLPNKKYKVMVCEYNGATGSEQYNTSSAINNPLIILTQSISCPSSFVDSRDGKTYHGVQIGNQCWMKENLNVGTKINNTENQTNNNKIEKYCMGDLESNCNEYGGLYTWDELMQYTNVGVKGLCPSGWHVPSDEEWCTLTSFIDANVNCNAIETWSGSDIGGKMKEAGTYHWSDPNTGTTNSSGFSALGGGYRRSIGAYMDFTTNALFWSSSEINSDYTWYRGFINNRIDLFRGTGYRADGLSVRCVINDNIEGSPTIQSSNSIFNNVQPNQFSLNWTDGNGDSRAVFIKKDTTETASPVNNTTYTGNSTFGSGTQIGTSGWYCIFNGNNHTSDITITNLEENTNYKVMVCEYNGTTGSEQYNLSSAMNNPKIQKTTCNSNPIPINGLVALYPFDGNANDASGNGNNGTVYGATLTNDRFGNPNKAYYFDGVNDYIQVPNSNNLNFGLATDFTVNLWIKINTPFPPQFLWGLIEKAPPDGGQGYGWQLATGGTGALYSEPGSFNSSQILTANTTYMITYIVERQTLTAKYYINGFLDTQNISEGYLQNFTNQYPLRIGIDRTLSSWANFYFHGVLDDIRIYNRALSICEVQTLYQESYSLSTQATNVTFSNITTNQLTFNWTDGNGSNRAVFIKQDSVGTAIPINNTTYTANSTFGSGTQIGTSGWYCVFNGTTHPDRVTVTNLLPNTKYQVMVCEYNGTAGSEQYNTSSAINNPKAQKTNSYTIDKYYSFYVFRSTLENYTNNKLFPNQWYNIVVTRSNVTNLWELYINGVLKNTAPRENVQYNLFALSMGYNNWGGPNSFYNGIVDEFRISNTVRTASEILTNYNSNQPLEIDANTVALWHFNETGGTSVNNSVNSVLGTLYNGVSFVNGKFANALKFDGQNDHADLNFDVPDNIITTEYWIKFDTILPSYQCILYPNGSYIWDNTLRPHADTIQPGTLFVVTTTSNPENGGNTTGSNTYLNGTQVAVGAVSNSGWKFINWTENGSVVSTDPSYTFMVSDNRNLVANFISTVGIDESESRLKIFPNPTTGIIDIQSAKNIENIVIYNSMGAQVIYKTVNKPTLSLDLSQFGKGIYSIRMTIGEKTMIRKVIVL